MARIGGLYPLGQNMVPITLPSGGTYYFPAGNYDVILGANTVLQQWDHQSQAWRSITYFAGFLSTDGANFRLLNITGIAQGPTITAVGSGATNGIGTSATGVTLTVSAAGANGRLATAYPIVGGSINSTVTITTAGAGLLVPPTLIVQPPPLGGVQAKMTCTISSGAINTVTVDDIGAGYTVAPTVVVVPQLAGYPGETPPSPATAVSLGATLPYNTIQNFASTAINTGVYTTLPVLTVNTTLTNSGALTGVVMIDNGALYAGTPTLTVTGAGAATATLAATVAAADDTSFVQPAVQ